MIIILYGPDTFRGRQKLNELKEEYLKKHKGDFSFEKLDAAEIDFSQLKHALEAQGLFAQKRFVILENLSQSADLLKQLASYKNLKQTAQDKDTILVLFEEGENKSAGFKKLLAAANKKQHFKKLSAGEQIKYFSHIFTKADRQIIAEVVNLCGADMWAVHNELKKLTTYKADGKITKEDLQTLGVGGFEAQIFKTIDAIFAKNPDKAFHQILLHWQAGEPAQILFSMIERQLKITAALKDNPSAAKTLGLHPYVAKKTMPLSRRFEWPKIKQLYGRTVSLDKKIKTGEIEPRLGVELLSAAIMA